MIVRRARRSAAPPPARESPRRRAHSCWPLLAGLLLAAAVAGILLARGDGGGANADSGEPVRLQGSAAFDPSPGDGEEHSDEAGLATDNNPATFWRTENYRASLELIGKPGVGLVLDAGSKRQVDQVVLTTDTPGFTAEIKAGGSPEGPFETVGGEQTVEDSTTWELDDADARYYVVWITELDGNAHVNEVRAG